MKIAYFCHIVTMEVKKTFKADLERKRIYFFLAGFIVSVVLLMIVLEWKHREQETLTAEDLENFITLDEEIEIDNQSYVIPEIHLSSPDVYIEIYDVVDNRVPVKMPEIIPWEDTEEEITQDIISLNRDTSALEEIIYTQVDEMPEFPGGYQAFIQYLAKRIRYPSSAVRQKITGRVICSFVIDKEGKVTQPQIVQGSEPIMDIETLRVIRNMPQWKPGKNKGKEVPVKFVVPVSFRM